MYFDELDLNDYVLDALDDMQFETCTPIQESCIPHILAGRDILGVAQTGTGKTPPLQAGRRRLSCRRHQLRHHVADA